MSENKKDYSFLMPTRKYLVIKKEEEESVGLAKSGQSEDRAYGRVIAIGPVLTEEESVGLSLKVGDLIVYNEYEGQELFKFKDLITEEGIIVLKAEDVLLKIKE